MLSSRPPAFLDYLPGGELSGEALATPPRTSATAFATGHNGNKRRGLWRHWLTFGAAGPGRPGRPSLPFIHASASENTRDPRCVFWPPKMCGMTLREPRLLDILLLEKKFPCRVADKAGWLLQGQARGPRMLSPALLSEAGVRPDARTRPVGQRRASAVDGFDRKGMSTFFSSHVGEAGCVSGALLRGQRMGPLCT